MASDQLIVAQALPALVGVPAQVDDLSDNLAAVKADTAAILALLNGGVTPTPTPTPSTYAAFSITQVSPVAENGAVVFTVTTPAATVDSNVTLTVSAASGSTGSAADWQGGFYPTAILSFPAGTTTKTFTAYPQDDAIVEGTEAFVATLSSPTNNATLVASQIQFSIIDNDTATQITSPSAYTTPSTSARYVQPTSSTAGTWSKGSGGNAASFTTPNATTGIYSPLSNLAAGTYVMPLVFTPTSGPAVTMNVTFTVVTNVATGSKTITDIKTFPGTANSLLASNYPGWTVVGNQAAAEEGGPILVGDGSIKGNFPDMDPSNSPHFLIGHDFGDVKGGSIRVDHYNLKDGNGTIEEVSLLALDSENRVVIRWSVAGGAPTDPRKTINLDAFIIKAGVTTTFSQVVPGNIDFAPDAHDFVMCIDVSSDGNTLGFRPSTSLTAVRTLDISSFTNRGSLVGFGSVMQKYVNPDSSSRIRSVGFQKGGNTLTVTSAPGVSADNRAVYVLKWIGDKPAAIDHSFAPAGTSDWSEWLTDASVINDSGEIIVAATFPDNAERRVRFRQRDDTIVTVEAPLTLKPLHPLARPFDRFMNVTNTNYYQFSNPASVEHERICLSTPTNIAIPGLVGGGRFVLNGGNSDFVITQAFDFGEHLTTGATVDAGITNITQTGPGVWEMDIVANGNSNRGVSYTGTHVQGNFTLRKKGEVGPTQDGWTDRMEGIGIRNLDSISNGPNQTTLQSVSKTFPEAKFQYDPNGQQYQGTDFGTTPQMVIAINAEHATNPSFRHYVLAMNVYSDDAYYTAHATYLRDNLHPDVIIDLEYSNETLFFPLYAGVGRGSGQWLVRDAFMAGGYGPAGNEPAITNIDYGTGPFFPQDDDGSGPAVTKKANVAGDRYVYGLTGKGLVVVKCVQSAPSGTSLLDTAYFTVEFTSEQLYEIMERRFLKKNLALINIFKNVFGASYSTRVKPMAMWGSRGADYYDHLAAYNPAWAAEIVNIGCQGYTTDETNPNGTNFDYFATSITKEQIGANFDYALRTQTIPRLMSFARGAIDRGKGIILYEAGQHGFFDRATRQGTNAYATAFAQWRASPLARKFERDQMLLLGAVWPGLWGQFLDFNPFWGLTPTSLDDRSQSARYLGQQDGLMALRAA